MTPSSVKSKWGYEFIQNQTYPEMWTCGICYALTFSVEAHSEWHVKQNHRINSAASTAWVD